MAPPALLRSLGMLGLMVLALLVGRAMRVPGTDFSLLWPAVGVAVWWMLGRRPMRVHALDATLLVLAVTAVSLATGAPAAVAVTFAFINLVHGVLGAVVLHRTGVVRRGLTGVGGVAAVLGTAVAAGVVSGALSAAAGALLYGSDPLATLKMITLRNVAGTFLPLLVVLAILRPRRFRELLGGDRRGEWVAAIAAGSLAYAVVFGILPGIPMAFSVMPLFVWFGVRLGLARTVALTAALGMASTVLTVGGQGTFSSVESPMIRSGVMQGFLVVSMLAGASLAASQESRNRAAAALAEAKATMTALIDAALVGNSVVIVEGEHVGRLVLPNPSLQRLLRTPPLPLPGAARAVEEATCWLSYLFPEDVPRVRAVLDDIASGSITEWSGELPHRRSDASIVWAQVHLSVLPSGLAPSGAPGAEWLVDGTDEAVDDAPPAAHKAAVVQFLDVTARRDAEEQLTHLALHDGLTGLPNRVLLRDRIELALAASERSGTYVALVFLDLDHFKSVNDSLGHDAGDLVLAEVARRLARVVRPTDTIARIGGDEFVACYPEVPGREEAEVLAERLLAAVTEPVWLGDRFVPVAASAGLTLSGYGDDAPTLLRQSDAAMYAAKRAGRGRVASFDQALEARANRHLTLSGELREALAKDQFVLHYQPIVDVATGAVTACEALVRWQHPHRGLLAPGDWLDVAEESDLIVQLGEWVLRRATQDMATVAETIRPLKVHVNVSGRQLARPGLVRQVATALSDSRLPAHLVVLELTETHLLEIHGSLLNDLGRLRQIGVELSVDDFGTGFSSLTQLVKLPIDSVKIDRSFVSGAAADPKAGAVVRGVLGMANALGLAVVAEGVETPAQAAFLERIGCPSAQGFLWSPAVDLQRLRALLADGTRLVPL